MKIHKGFSLIEIMIAFVIMSIALTMVIRVFATGQQIIAETENYTIAVQIAESVIARAGEDISLDQNQFESELENKYYWYMTIQPLFIDYKSLNDEQFDTSLQLKRINVYVSWEEDDGGVARVELSTIKQ